MTSKKLRRTGLNWRNTMPDKLTEIKDEELKVKIDSLLAERLEKLKKLNPNELYKYDPYDDD